MKKTLIALLALTGVAVASEEATETYAVTFAGCATSTTDALIDNVTLEVEGEMTAKLTSLVNSDSTSIGLVTTGTAGADATVFTPNSNVGNGAPWTATFKFDNVNNALASLDSITLDAVIFQGSGNYHPSGTTWTGNIVFTSTITTGTASDAVTLGSYTSTLTPQRGQDDGVFEVTLAPTTEGSPIDLTGVSSFNMTLALTETLSGGAFVGLKGMELTGQLVPEPTTATLSLLALAGLAARRRRK